ncbi:MAG TPA: hypothetical protein VMV57_11495, partial [Terracidiphilus sp.]|nr:hypothetical protein [Terracidiphilus sp.]
MRKLRKAGAVALVMAWLAMPVVHAQRMEILPDAPRPAGAGMSEAPGAMPEAAWPNALAVRPADRERVPLDQCPYDTTHARECRVHWRQLLISSAVFNAFQNAGNLYSGYWYRWETTHGKWADRWFDSVLEWRWDHWSDDNPFMDQYVGHPMMGGITDSMWIQNDPKGMTLEFSNTRPYWKSRLRAMAFSTAYSFEWKMGPFGEAGIGHNGDHFFTDHGVRTNETGDVELVTTPVGGLLWTVAEDVLDKKVVRRLEAHPRGPVTLTLISFLTPATATANVLRFRPPWYRDSRTVKANSFFSEPDGPTMSGPESSSADGATAAAGAGEGEGSAESAAAGVRPVRPGAPAGMAAK